MFTPLTEFIATIKLRAWLTVALLTVGVVVFASDPTASDADRALVIISLPIMMFELAFLAFVHRHRRFDARELFPSVLLAISAFVAAGIVNAMIDGIEIPLAVAIPLGAFLALVSSLGFVLIHRRRPG